MIQLMRITPPLMRFAGAVLLGASLAALAAAQSGAPSDSTRDRAVLAGRVRDQFGHPIKGAAVQALDQGLLAIVDDSGVFQIRDLLPGPSRFTVTRVGYAPTSFVLELPADSTIFVDVHLQPMSRPLFRNVATGRTLRSYSDVRLNATGWDDRRRTLIGYFIGPDEIVSVPHPHVAQYLIGLPGVAVRPRPSGVDGVTFTIGRACEPRVFVDGRLTSATVEAAVSASQLFAIEVYPLPSLVPEKFASPTREQPCGVVALWTRKYEP